MSIRQEYRTEGGRFRSQPQVAGRRFELSLNIRSEHYPFFSRQPDKIDDIRILAKSGAANLTVFDRASDANGVQTLSDALVKDPALGNLFGGRFTGGATGLALPANPVTELKLYFETKALTDLWLAVVWSKA